MEIRILGPLEVSADGEQVDLGRGRQRALLAMLAIHRGEVVSTDRLIEALWAGDPPPTAGNALRNLVSQLRKALRSENGDVLVTTPSGYALRLSDDAVDAGRFERLAAEGGKALETDPEVASARLREALALWRGDPLVDFTYEPFAEREIVRLEELRLCAVEDRFDAELALGRGADLVPELESRVGAHPTRERLRGQLMVGLYRAGRQADALQTYRDWSTWLRSETGLEPGPSVRELERRILTQDPELAPPARLPGRQPGRGAPRPSRRVVAAAVAIAVLAVAAVATVRALSTAEVEPNSVMAIDTATNEVVRSIPVGVDPGQVGAAAGFVFVVSEEDHTLTRIDPRSGAVRASGRYDADGGLVALGRRLWVASRVRAEVVEVDPDTMAPLGRVGLPANLAQALLALGAGSLWISEYAPSAVSRWSLRTLREQERYPLGPDQVAADVVVGEGAAWAGLPWSNELLRIDTGSGAATRVPVGVGPSQSAFGFGSIWVGMTGDATVWRVDAGTGRARAIIPVGVGPWGIATGAGSVWVANHCDGTVSRIDPRTNDVVATIETGFHPKWLAAGGGTIWVGVAKQAAWRTPACPPVGSAVSAGS